MRSTVAEGLGVVGGIPARKLHAAEAGVKRLVDIAERAVERRDFFGEPRVRARARRTLDRERAFGKDFRSADGQRFMVAALTAKQWAALVSAFDVADGIAAIEAQCGVSFADSDHNRFVHRETLFALFQRAADRFDYATLAERLTRAGATFERYRTMHEAATDPELVTNNPLFGPSPANPSGFAYPATRSFAHVPNRNPGDPLPAPRLGEHSAEVLERLLGLSSGVVGASSGTASALRWVSLARAGSRSQARAQSFACRKSRHFWVISISFQRFPFSRVAWSPQFPLSR